MQLHAIKTNLIKELLEIRQNLALVNRGGNNKLPHIYFNNFCIQFFIEVINMLLDEEYL